MAGETEITTSETIIATDTPLPKAPVVAPKVAPVKTAPVVEAADEEVELTGKVLPDDADEDQVEKYVDKDGKLHIPWKSFKTRIARAKKAELQAVFGTADRAAILAQKEEYEKLVNDREKQRKAQLDELTREKEEKAAAVAKAEKLEKALATRDEKALIDEATQVLAKSAGKAFADDYVDFAMSKYRKHLRTLTDDEIEALTEDDSDEWFTAEAKKHKAMARPVDKDDKAEDKKKKVGVTNGTGGGNDRPSKAAGEKTIKEMTKDEIHAKYGVRW
jgi:hypothetical protein